MDDKKQPVTFGAGVGTPSPAPAMPVISPEAMAKAQASLKAILEKQDPMKLLQPYVELVKMKQARADMVFKFIAATGGVGTATGAEAMNKIDGELVAALEMYQGKLAALSQANEKKPA